MMMRQNKRNVFWLMMTLLMMTVTTSGIMKARCNLDSLSITEHCTSTDGPYYMYPTDSMQLSRLAF